MEEAFLTVHSRSKCTRKKIPTPTPTVFSRRTGEKNNPRLKEGGGGVEGGGGQDVVQGGEASKNVLTFSFLSFPLFLFFFFPLKLEKLGLTRLLFQQQQQAVDTLHVSQRKENNYNFSRPLGQEAFII